MRPERTRNVLQTSTEVRGSGKGVKNSGEDSVRSGGPFRGEKVKVGEKYVIFREARGLSFICLLYKETSRKWNYILLKHESGRMKERAASWAGVARGSDGVNERRKLTLENY